MQKTDDYIANRLTWKASKYNLPTKSSFYYKDISADLQRYLSSYLDKEHSGQPILIFTKQTKEWTLIPSPQCLPPIDHRLP